MSGTIGILKISPGDIDANAIANSINESIIVGSGRK